MKCQECKKEAGTALFCSIECACYSGMYNLKTGWKVSKDEFKQIKHIRNMEEKGYTTPYSDY